MIEIITADDQDGLAAAAQLLHDFNLEYDEPSPAPGELAAVLAARIRDGQATLLIARERGSGIPVGVAAVRLQPSLWSDELEAYLAELYVVPDRRGDGYGRALITETMRHAREQGADYAYIITSEDDRQAQRLYEAAGFRRTEGEDGPLMLAYERDL